MVELSVVFKCISASRDLRSQEVLSLASRKRNWLAPEKPIQKMHEQQHFYVKFTQNGKDLAFVLKMY